MPEPDGPAVGASSSVGSSASGDAPVREVSATAIVANPQGIHLRPATALAQISSASGCRVHVSCGGRGADGASILELAMLAIGVGTEVTLRVTGAHPEPTLDALVALIQSPSVP